MMGGAAAGATAGAMTNPYAKDAPARDDDEAVDFESMSETIAGDDEIAEDDALTEGEIDTFEDDVDDVEDDETVEGDDDEGYF